jgi:hypothetical protein
LAEYVERQELPMLTVNEEPIQLHVVTNEEPGPSRRNIQPSPVIASTPPPPTSPSPAPPPPAQHATPQRSPRRRRLRRDPPMSAEAARRALVRISEERAAIERRNSDTLESLLLEIREIKDILRSR